MVIIVDRSFRNSASNTRWFSQPGIVTLELCHAARNTVIPPIAYAVMVKPRAKWSIVSQPYLRVLQSWKSFPAKAAHEHHPARSNI
jgi:hypothetical protein